MSSALEQISDVLAEHTLCQVGPMSALGQIEEIVNAELLRSAPQAAPADECPQRSGEPCLPVWISADLICYHCRRLLPSPRAERTPDE